MQGLVGGWGDEAGRSLQEQAGCVRARAGPRRRACRRPHLMPPQADAHAIVVGIQPHRLDDAWGAGSAGGRQAAGSMRRQAMAGPAHYERSGSKMLCHVSQECQPRTLLLAAQPAAGAPPHALQQAVADVGGWDGGVDAGHLQGGRAVGGGRRGKVWHMSHTAAPCAPRRRCVQSNIPAHQHSRGGRRRCMPASAAQQSAVGPHPWVTSVSSRSTFSSYRWLSGSLRGGGRAATACRLQAWPPAAPAAASHSAFTPNEGCRRIVYPAPLPVCSPARLPAHLKSPSCSMRSSSRSSSSLARIAATRYSSPRPAKRGSTMVTPVGSILQASTRVWEGFGLASQPDSRSVGRGASVIGGRGGGEGRWGRAAGGGGGRRQQWQDWRSELPAARHRAGPLLERGRTPWRTCSWQTQQAVGLLLCSGAAIQGAPQALHCSCNSRLARREPVLSCKGACLRVSDDGRQKRPPLASQAVQRASQTCVESAGATPVGGSVQQ